METNYAYYKLPHKDCYTHVQPATEPTALASCEGLNGQEGFVIAPFTCDDRHPVLLLDDSTAVTKPLPAMPKPLPAGHVEVAEGAMLHRRYAIDFANFHSYLETGLFQKIVLARTLDVPHESNIDTEQLFLRACQSYPDMFVALFSTPQSGTWLISTPETLVEGDGHQWHTMALAGTMPAGAQQWSDKNRQEQRHVFTYIMECLEHFAEDIHADGPRTVQAANLLHLQTTLTFTLGANPQVGSLLQRLHPTPAVCGLPKEATRQFILHNEALPRGYYSGFAGALHPNADTHLFVSLRCMQILPDRFRLFAGGGLLNESQMEEEWQETEAKLQTMLKVIAGSGRRKLPPLRLSTPEHDVPLI